VLRKETWNGSYLIKKQKFWFNPTVIIVVVLLQIGRSIKAPIIMENTLVLIFMVVLIE